MTIYERVKHLRKDILKMNQEEFSKKINTSRSNIGNVEVGRVNITDRNISIICKEFNVSEEWLRNGTGEMFVQYDSDTEMAFLVGQFAAEDDPIKTKFATFLLKQIQDEERWPVLRDMLIDFNRILDEKK